MSQSTGKEFRRQPQITLQMQLTSEQHTALKEWHASIPTLYFLDICVANATKLSDAAVERDARKANLINHLRDLDKSQHSFSYLFALIEKVSDLQGSLSHAELEHQVLADVTELRAFFKNASVVESDDFLVNYLKLRRVAPELRRPDSLKFLEAANNQFALHNPVSPKFRYRRAAEILKEADAQSMARQHPVVLLTLACLYGNASAKKLMKFKADAENFNAENALADIMVISRFAAFKLEIEDLGRQGKAKYLRSEFITDDSGLLGVLKCFEPKAVRFEAKDDVHETRTDVSVNLEQLLPDLAAKRRDKPHEIEELTKHEPDEYQQVCDLLAQAPGDPL